MAPEERLTYCQLSNNSIDDRRAFAVSLTATRCGDGVCSDFGVFAITHTTADEDTSMQLAARVARTVATELLQQFYHLVLDDRDDLPAINEILSQTVKLANSQIRESNGNSETGVGLTAVVVLDNRLFLTNIGNGCAFLTNEDGFQRLTGATKPEPTLLGNTEKAPESDIVIKYLPPYSGILVTSADVWNLQKVEDILSQSVIPSFVCAELKKIAPPENLADLASVMVRLGHLQQ